MIEIELFDGTVLEFPAGTDPAVIDRVAKQETAARRDAAAPPEPSLVDTIMGYGQEGLRRAGYLAQEAGRGTMMMLGAPADLANMLPMAGNLLPGEQGIGPITDGDAVFGGDWFFDRRAQPGGFTGPSMLWDASTDLARRFLGDDNQFLNAVSTPDVEAPEMQPRDVYDRVGGRIAQEVGAATVPIGAMASAADRLGTVGTRAMQEGNLISRWVGRALEPYAVNSLRSSARDAAMAVAAGTGAGLAREIAPEDEQELYDFLGALGGVGVATAGSALTNLAGNTFNAVTGRGDDVVKEAAANVLGQVSNAPVTPSGALDTSGVAGAIATGRRISDVVPGYRDTTADVTQIPGIAALEQSRAAVPESGGQFAQRNQENAQAVGTAISGMAPDATPGEFSGALDARRNEQFRAVDQSAQANVAAAEAEFEQAIRAFEEAEAAAVTGATDAATTAARAAEDAQGRLRPTMPAEARGAEVRMALEAAEEAARKVEKQAWSQVQGDVDPSQLAARIAAVTDGLELGRQDAIRDLAETLNIPNRLLPDDEVAAATEGFAVPVREITSMRSRLTTAMRQASAAGDTDRAEIIGRYVDAIDEQLAASGVSEALENARAVSRDLNDRFTRRGDAVAETLATRPSGGPIVQDSTVAGRFIQPDEGQVSTTQRLLDETDRLDPPRAVRPALADQMRAETQGMTPEQITRYTAERTRMMELFPDLEADLAAAARTGTAAREAERTAADTARAAARERAAGTREAQRTLTDRQRAETARVEETRAALFDGRGNDPRAIVGRYLEFGDERAADAMSRVVNSANPTQAITDLMNFVGNNPRAVEGAKAAFWSLMERTAQSTATSRTSGGTRVWSHQRLAEFLQDPKNRAVAQRLYADNPEHLENLQTVAETLRNTQIGNTTVPASGRLPRGLVGNELLPSAETVGSRGFAVARQQVGLTFLVANFGSIILRRAMLRGREREFNALIDSALLNPEIAAGLAKDYNPADLAALRRAVKAHFGVRVAQFDDLLADEEEPGEDDEMMQAIGAPE